MLFFEVDTVNDTEVSTGASLLSPVPGQVHKFIVTLTPPSKVHMQ